MGARELGTDVVQSLLKLLHSGQRRRDLARHVRVVQAKVPAQVTIESKYRLGAHMTVTSYKLRERPGRRTNTGTSTVA